MKRTATVGVKKPHISASPDSGRYVWKAQKGDFRGYGVSMADAYKNLLENLSWYR